MAHTKKRKKPRREPKPRMRVRDATEQIVELVTEAYNGDAPAFYKDALFGILTKLEQDARERALREGLEWLQNEWIEWMQRNLPQRPGGYPTWPQIDREHQTASQASEPQNSPDVVPSALKKAREGVCDKHNKPYTITEDVFHSAEDRAIDT